MFSKLKNFLNISIKKIIRHQFQFQLQLQRPLIQRSEQNVVTSVGTLVLTFDRI